MSDDTPEGKELERLRRRMERVAEYADIYDGDIAGAIRDALNMDDETWDEDSSPGRSREGS